MASSQQNHNMCAYNEIEGHVDLLGGYADRYWDSHVLQTVRSAKGFKSCVTLGRAKTGNQARRAASITRESESAPHLSAFSSHHVGAALKAEGAVRWISYIGSLKPAELRPK